MNHLILLAAGSGQRMAQSVPDKVLAPLAGMPVFLHSLHSFFQSGVIAAATITYRDEKQRVAIEGMIPEVLRKDASIHYTVGGSTRQQSVLAALRTLPENTTSVFVHDAARPLISIEAIQNLHQAVEKDGGAALAHPVNDTIKRLPNAFETQRISLEDLQRDHLWAMETPQAFPYEDLLQAYQIIEEQQQSVTDDAGAYSILGRPMTLVHNNQPNPKLTNPQDLDYLEYLLNRSKCDSTASR